MITATPGELMLSRDDNDRLVIGSAPNEITISTEQLTNPIRQFETWRDGRCFTVKAANGTVAYRITAVDVASQTFVASLVYSESSASPLGSGTYL